MSLVFVSPEQKRMLVTFGAASGISPTQMLMIAADAIRHMSGKEDAVAHLREMADAIESGQGFQTVKNPRLN